MIKEFSGKNRFLSNFYPCKIEYKGNVFPSIEHAYQSAKSDDPLWVGFCCHEAVSPNYIKFKSRSILIKENWDLLKLDVMEECVRNKFSKDPLRTKLIETGDLYLQEGNSWNDKYWGICLRTNEGENHLGKILMKIRKELIEKKKLNSLF